MGYWEQIGVDNQRHRERRARMRLAERRIRDIGGMVLVTGASMALWALMLAPVAVLAWRAML